ncbi:MAG: hypothetical protein ACFFB5_15430 [Promethearchaeota archaeon]
MTKSIPNFEFIANKIRNQTFGLLDIISPEGETQTSGVSYGVSPPESKFGIYILSNQNDLNFKKIKGNPRISFSIPLCHRFICFLPFSTVYFESKAEIIPYNNSEAQKIFRKTRKLRTMLKEAIKLNEEKGLIFIRLKPSKRVLLYRPSLSFRSLLRKNERTYDIIKIPEDKY